jgi:hypothetical protein
MAGTIAGPVLLSCLRSSGTDAADSAMAEVDVRLIRLVRQLDEERKKRVNAERSATQAKLLNAKLHARIQQLTKDAAPPKGLDADK